MNLRVQAVSEQLSAIFIGILISFILGVIGIYSKLFEIVKSLTKIEEHTGRIPGLEDKMIELRLAFEKGKLSSIPVELSKSKVQLVVTVKNRTEDTTHFEITAREPIPAKIAKTSVGRLPQLRAATVSSYQITFTLGIIDAAAAAEIIKRFLDILDEEWFKEKHWEDIFKSRFGRQ